MQDDQEGEAPREFGEEGPRRPVPWRQQPQNPLEDKRLWLGVGVTALVTVLLLLAFIIGRATAPVATTEKTVTTKTETTVEEPAERAKTRALTASVHNEPAPAESAPSTGTVATAPVAPPVPAKAPPKVLFQASVASDLSRVTSFVVQPDEQKVSTAFDAVVSAFAPHKFSASDKAKHEWVYTREAKPAQGITFLEVNSEGVVVTLKCAPSKEDLIRITGPVKSLAALFGLPAEGEWKQNGLVSTFTFQPVATASKPPAAAK